MHEHKSHDDALTDVKNTLKKTGRGRPVRHTAKTEETPPVKSGHKRQGISLLDAAVQVLEANRKVPMSIGEIFEEISVKRLWKSEGKTPCQTLSSVVQREILRKGKRSRIKRAKEKGKFVIA